MSRFLETIRISAGVPQHLEWHQRRVDDTFRHFYPAADPITLHDLIRQSPIPEAGDLRCRILYDDNGHEIGFSPLEPRIVRSLRLTDLPPDYDYQYKYADRRILELAFSRRGDADDVLLLRDGWVTDTSVANVAFLSHGRWYTPVIPLLAGTTWKRLVCAGVIVPRPIHADDLHCYEACVVFNALNDWDERLAILVDAICR
jgi:4-amino-4-deoxychorismate lyase